MCFVSTPSVSNTNTPPPQFLHSMLLDGMNNQGTGSTMGRAQLVNQENSGALNAPTATTGAQSGVQVPTVHSGTQAPGAVGAPVTSTNPVASAGSGGSPTLAPGTVVPTVGGSMAGAVPPYLTIGGASPRMARP